MRTLVKYIREIESDVEFTYVTDAQEGYRKLSNSNFDLVLLDVVLPLGIDDEPSEDGSLWFVNEVQEKIDRSVARRIVGTTQFAESIPRVEGVFREYLLDVIYVTNDDGKWKRQLRYALDYSRSKATQSSLTVQNEIGDVDVAIVTALGIPEFNEVTDAIGGGEPFLIKETNESWLFKRMDFSGRQVSVVAACANEMGMPSMAAMVTRLCVACRPKNLILCGIMGGNSKHVALSDIVAVEITWDIRAGKITETGFEPDIKEQRCNQNLLNLLRHIVDDQALREMYRSWDGERPGQPPRLLAGAVACSPAVIADSSIIADLERRMRKILGVEMEAFGCYDAVHRLGDLAPKTLCIKSVCDLGDKNKNDNYQRYCAYLSAHATLRLIESPNFLGE